LNGSRSNPGKKDPKLFDKKMDAEKYAQAMLEKYGHRWELHVKKWNARYLPNPYQLKAQ
jgi:hypothetical protein